MKVAPFEYYTAEVKHYQEAFLKVDKALKRYSIIRFCAFFSTLFLIYFFLGEINIMLTSLLVGGIIFSVFLKKYWHKKEAKDHLSRLISINKLELSVLQGDVFMLDAGDRFKNAKHAFSFDIDVFGEGSFFQFLNRTVTQAGTEKLVSIVNENKLEGISEKQIAIIELAKLSKWRQEFSALAGSVDTEISPNEIIRWLHSHKTSLPGFGKWLPFVFSIISLLLILVISFLNISFNFLTIWFFVGLVISGVFIKKVNHLYLRVGKVKATFQQYQKLLELLEGKEFSAPVLSYMRSKINNSNKFASKEMAVFFNYLNALDQRNNVIFAIFGNGLLLWDFKQAYRVEQWMDANKDYVKDWFEVISFFDAYNSLANYAFNNPDFTYAAISNELSVIDAKGLGHPSLAASNRVTSDCVIAKKDFFMVTGANMAGKSTFLRTVSLSILMSNIGLPVCAQEMRYNPIKLITSIRNSDSLSEDTSYFFSELKRLKYIVDAIKDDNYFIVLDEILKGTNSTDKVEGSQKFVEKLLASNATGIIATHDLSLCEIESKYPEIHNYYFDAEIKNDELYFDYKLKKGVCQNMNASFLLRKMEIV
jgi:hypothetical protein